MAQRERVQKEKPKGIGTIRTIIAIILFIGIACGALYVLSYGSYLSDEKNNEQCKICAQKYNLVCKDRPAIQNIYSLIKKLHPLYADCRADVNLYRCDACVNNVKMLK